MSTSFDPAPAGDHDGERTAAPDGDTRLETGPTDRRTVVAREKEAYGGVKVGSAFFGWLTATGTAVLLTALVAAAGAAVGLSHGAPRSTRPTSQASQDPTTVGVAGGIALLVILFVSYYCGGYVAGRMARFNGFKQGVAVWLWALLIAVVVAVLGAVAGSRYDVLAQLNSFPRIPVNEGTLTTGGIIACSSSPWPASPAPSWADWPACGSTAGSTGPGSAADRTLGRVMPARWPLRSPGRR